MMQIREVKQMAQDISEGVGFFSYVVGFLGSIVTHLSSIETPVWIKLSTILGCIYLCVKIWNELSSGIISRREHRRKKRSESEAKKTSPS